MGITKKHIHTQDQIELARMFKALGHPARIAIIENLLTHDNLNCNGLKSHIQLAQSTISYHIKELHEAGILAVSVIGNNGYYEVHKNTLEHVSSYLDQIFQKIDAIPSSKLFVYFRPWRKIALPDFINTT